MSGRRPTANERELAERTETALREIADATDAAALDAVRVRYVGRKDGELTARLKGLAGLPIAERPAAGAALNRAKTAIEAALSEREQALRERSLDASLTGTALDLSLPGRPVRLGRLHPISRAIRDISRIFLGMGFESVEGPEIEWDYYNFEALNIRQVQHAVGRAGRGDRAVARAHRHRRRGRPGWRRGARHGADALPHAHLTDADPDDGASATAGADHRARAVLPVRGDRRDP